MGIKTRARARQIKRVRKHLVKMRESGEEYPIVIINSENKRKHFVGRAFIDIENVSEYENPRPLETENPIQTAKIYYLRFGRGKRVRVFLGDISDITSNSNGFIYKGDKVNLVMKYDKRKVGEQIMSEERTKTLGEETYMLI